MIMFIGGCVHMLGSVGETGQTSWAESATDHKTNITVRHRIARSQICNRNYLLFLKRKKNIFGVKMSAESQITALGISLPDAPKPGGVGFLASQ